MLKLILLLAVIFNIFINIISEQDACEAGIVELDQDFIRCCRKPSYSSDKCIEMSEYNNSIRECFANCMYSDLKIYDGNKFVIKEVEEYFIAHKTSDDLRIMFVAGFTYCSEMDESVLVHKLTFANLSTIEGCDLYPSYVDLCVWYYAISHCPTSYMNLDDAACPKKIEWVHHCLLN